VTIHTAHCVYTDHGDIDTTGTHEARKPGWKKPNLVCDFHAEWLTGRGGWEVAAVVPETEEVVDPLTGVTTVYQIGRPVGGAA
jgi:hypothetical protein